jgi:glucose-6-phosphate 1-dehydrogenase
MAIREVEPHIFVIFGATGDLMKRSLLPALRSLSAQGITRDKCIILGTARSTELNDTSFRQSAFEAFDKQGIKLDDGMNTWIEQSLFFQTIGEEKPENFAALAERIRCLEEDRKFPGNRIFYLALPPIAFPGTIERLGEVGLNNNKGWTRIVIEKPFGRDLESARALNNLIHKNFDESQVYRIDHYLGKETVQNLLVFRFANPIFESLWNRDRIQSVQITVAEDLGIEKRAGYYDRAGALRDMVQNHLTQLLTLIAMEIPVAFDSDGIRAEKVKVLRSITPIQDEQIILGQYIRGAIDGHEVPGYLEEQNVPPDSATETFVALQLDIATWRWHGVPFYLRTGKRLPHRLTQIVINFRRAPVSIFDPVCRCEMHSNSLNIILQPDEGFDLCFEMKALGEPMQLQTQSLRFRYGEAFAPLPDAYETLLLDLMVGDQTLFVHADEVEASWKLYTPIIEHKPRVYPYRAGSWGPFDADRLVKQEGQVWSNPDRREYMSTKA